MALVKICPISGHHNAPNATVCSCGAGLTGIVPEEWEPETEAPQASGADPVLELFFPFGPRVIAHGTVLGRMNADFGADIEASPNGGYVSGEHAVIIEQDRRFYVFHTGHSDRNRTYVDSVVVPEGQQVELRDGQRLSLSTEYHVTVRIR